MNRSTRTVRIEVLAGVECSIGEDGTLDAENAALQDLDVVLAGVHSGSGMPGQEMTQRMLAAMQISTWTSLCIPPEGSSSSGNRSTSTLLFFLRQQQNTMCSLKSTGSRTGSISPTYTA